MSIERINKPEYVHQRQDHIIRYKLATALAKQIKATSIVDCAAGIGYGSNMMANMLPSAKITSIELSQEAMLVYNKSYKLPNINYINSDYREVAEKELECDLFVSFEFIEHIWDSEIFMHKISNCSKYVILSTPNELVRPHKQSPINEHHVKHFRPFELELKLKRHGFKILERFSQKSGAEPKINKGTNGKFMIYIAKNNNL